MTATRHERVLVALSGGVDSSVAALCLVEQGYDVVGVFMRNGVRATGPAAGSCCSAADARDAAAVADRLGIPFYSIDFEREFQGLIDRFVAEYRAGRTPNPCVWCNQDLKFGHLLGLARALGAASVATGHYARADRGGLYRALDRAKDQTYYLFGIDREALAHARFPLGDLDKARVRELARRAGLVTADKPESMEICFVASGDYRDVVRARGGGTRPGRFVDEDGRELGRHDGIEGFTVGQRRGLPALGAPYYVKEIRPESAEVVLCRRDGLARRHAWAAAVRWLVDPPGRDGMRAHVQIRARSAARPAKVVPQEGPGRVRIEFDEAVEAVTPGQAAVFYAGDRVLGGGWLESTR